MAEIVCNMLSFYHRHHNILVCLRIQINGIYYSTNIITCLLGFRDSAGTGEHRTGRDGFAIKQYEVSVGDRHVNKWL